MTNKRSPESISMSRIRLVEVGSIIVSLVFTSFFAYKYLINPHINTNANTTKYQIIYDAIKSYAIEGTIVDRDGNTILGNAAAETRATADYPQNLSYAWLLGYYSVNDHRQNSFGLRGNLKDYLLFQSRGTRKAHYKYRLTKLCLPTIRWYGRKYHRT